jgi:hypothetical protein
MDGGGGRVGVGSRLGFGAADLGAQMRCGRCRARAGDTQTHTGGGWKIQAREESSGMAHFNKLQSTDVV